METHRLDTERAREFMLAGNATVTLQSIKTGKRFTYKVKQGEPQPNRPTIHFVSLMNGANNEKDFTYLGCIYGDGRYSHGRKSRVNRAAPSAIAFAWSWAQIQAGKASNLAIYHEGRCGACGRKLTVPESIESGYGPECASRRGFKAEAVAQISPAVAATPVNVYGDSYGLF